MVASPTATRAEPDGTRNREAEGDVGGTTGEPGAAIYSRKAPNAGLSGNRWLLLVSLWLPCPSYMSLSPGQPMIGPPNRFHLQLLSVKYFTWPSWNAMFDPPLCRVPFSRSLGPGKVLVHWQ